MDREEGSVHGDMFQLLFVWDCIYLINVLVWNWERKGDGDDDDDNDGNGTCIGIKMEIRLPRAVR